MPGELSCPINCWNALQHVSYRQVHCCFSPFSISVATVLGKQSSRQDCRNSMCEASMTGLVDLLNLHPGISPFRGEGSGAPHTRAEFPHETDNCDSAQECPKVSTSSEQDLGRGGKEQVDVLPLIPAHYKCICASCHHDHCPGQIISELGIHQGGEEVHLQETPKTYERLG